MVIREAATTCSIRGQVTKPCAPAGCLQGHMSYLCSNAECETEVFGGLSLLASFLGIGYLHQCFDAVDCSSNIYNQSYNFRDCLIKTCIRTLLYDIRNRHS